MNFYPCFFRKLSANLSRRESKTALFHSLINLKLRGRLGKEELEFLCDETKLDEKEIKTKYKLFLESHPEGEISQESFDKLLSECFPASRLEHIGQHTWRMFDINMDGVIDFSEFLVVVNIMSNGSAEQNLQQIFRFFDVNRNGTIEKLEMTNVVKDLFGAEHNHNDEEKLAQEAFTEMDENHDDLVSLEEFTRACLSNKKYSSVLTMKVVNLFLDK